jgi:phage terminase large subunit
MSLLVKPKAVQLELAYDPLPKQGQFHGANAKYRAFGGGFGNGKTAAGCAEAFFLSMEYPGTVGLIARKTRPELKATTQDVFFNGGGGAAATDWTGCPQELIRSFNKTEGKLTLINDSVIHFWPLDDPDKLTNLNLGWYLIDQAEEVAEDMFLMLNGRLRRKNSPRKGIILFNPNGHDWIWRRWVHLKMPDHELIHAKTSDNPNLPSDYISQFDGYPAAWRQRFFDGSFDVFTGQIWPEFDPDIHIIRPFDIPPWFEIVEGIDHGRRNPTAVLWAAFDDVGNCFIVDEHYKAGWRVGKHAEKILQRRATRWGQPNYTVIDASAAQKDPNTERSVIDEYWDYGIYTMPSDRHKIARVNRIAEWLKLKPNWPHPISNEIAPIPEDFDEDADDVIEYGYPNLYIFQNCVNLVEHIPQYQWKPQPPTQNEDAKEEPLKKDDHDVDALGYILMTRPQPAKKPLGTTAMDPRTTKYWEIQNKRRAKDKRGHSKLGAEA